MTSNDRKRETIFPGAAVSQVRLGVSALTRQGNAKANGRDHSGYQRPTQTDSRTTKRERKEDATDSATTVIATKQKRDRDETKSYPWKSYKKLYKLQFGDSKYMTVAEKFFSSSGEDNLAIIHNLSGLDTYNHVETLRQVQHPNFITLYNVFRHESTVSIVFEFMPLSLSELAGNPLIDELRLASILGQVSLI